MIAGQLAQLEEPTAEPFESWFREGRLPALDVKRTQAGIGDTPPIQSGIAASSITTTYTDISVGVNTSGEPVAIDEDTVEGQAKVSTEWVADPTETGLVSAESTAGNGEYPFPFDLFTAVTNTKCQILNVDVEALKDAWLQTDNLLEVWMAGEKDDEAVNLGYHGAAFESAETNVGLGFEYSWSGTVQRGVIYSSGYLAVYNTGNPEGYLSFVDDTISDFAFVPGDDEGEQATLSGGDQDFRDQVADHLDQEGVDAE